MNTVSADSLSGIITTLWVITGAIAIQLRASSKAQRKALRRLRDKDIQWALYAHELRLALSNEGIKPQEVPHNLLLDIDADPL